MDVMLSNLLLSHLMLIDLTAVLMLGHLMLMHLLLSHLMLTHLFFLFLLILFLFPSLAFFCCFIPVSFPFECRHSQKSATRKCQEESPISQRKNLLIDRAQVRQRSPRRVFCAHQPSAAPFGGGGGGGCLGFSWCVGGGDVLCCDVMWHDVMWSVLRWDEVTRFVVRWGENMVGEVVGWDDVMWCHHKLRLPKVTL